MGRIDRRAIKIFPLTDKAMQEKELKQRLACLTLTPNERIEEVLRVSWMAREFAKARFSGINGRIDRKTVHIRTL